MNRLIKKFTCAFNGLWIITTTDKSFQTQLVAGAIATLAITYVLFPLLPYEILFILTAWALVLITETQNSALEEALDTLHPERHENIKRSKDIAAASVLLSAGYAGLGFLVLVCVRLLG